MSAGLGPTLARLGASLPSHQQEVPSTENSRERKLATSLKEEEIRTHQSKQREPKFGRRGKELGLRPSCVFGDGQPRPTATAAGPPLGPHELPTAKVREQSLHPQSPLLPLDRRAHPMALPSQELREPRGKRLLRPRAPAPTGPTTSLEVAQLGTSDDSQSVSAAGLPFLTAVSAGRESDKGENGSDTSSLRTGEDREKWRWVYESLALSPRQAGGGHPTMPMPWGSGASIPLTHQVPAAHRGERAARGGCKLSSQLGVQDPRGTGSPLSPSKPPCGPLVCLAGTPKLVCPRGRGLPLPRLPAQPLIPSSHPSRPRSPLPFTGAGPEMRFQPLQSTRDSTSPG